MTVPQHQLTGSTRPGQMTVAMRVGGAGALGSHGPKLLRVGVVQGGSVRDDRTIKNLSHVSVGTSEDSTFLLGAGQPHSFRLFERVDGAYYLQFTDAMQGRIVLASGLFDLQQLKTDAQRTSRGAYRVALTEEARGKVVLGDVTFLFHFVAPAPTLPKPVLPSAVLRGARGVDWVSTICAAFSFLVHFMLLGAVYSDWADPVLDDDSRAAGLIDTIKHMPPPPPVEDKSPPDDAEEPHEAPQAANPKPSEPSPSKAASPGRAGPPSRALDPKLVDELEQIDASILPALSSSKPATEGVLRGDKVAWNSLDDAARSRAGVGAPPALGIDLGRGGAPVARGRSDAISSIGTQGRTADGTGRSNTLKGPQAEANVASPSTIGGAVSDAARVVAGLRGPLRNCYQRGLAENPDASGSIRLTIRVGAGGEVSGVSASPSGNLPASVISCVQQRAQVAQFAAPEGGSAVIVVPVTFVKQ
ncbi:MAG: AgmX/PglI C-terminal domain-containing protein [Polyangiaceae bacterium]